MSNKPTVSLTVAPSKAKVSEALCNALVPLAASALQARGSFSIALSGGSLPAFLNELPQAFAQAKVEPRWTQWHVLLADERCVPISDSDSNLKALQEHVLSKLTAEGLPASHIYGINTDLLDDTTAVATEYEQTLRQVLQQHTGGGLDVAVLGFGPDGHTCSLFPGHPLLKESQRWVAPIEDSPKPPPRRITLTLEPLLNTRTRHVLFCGAGASKSPILKANFGRLSETATTVGEHKRYTVEPNPLTEASYPCARVCPSGARLEDNTQEDNKNTVTWIVDADAMKDVAVSGSS